MPRTMAPQVLPETRRSFPALSHLDGTARHQSVAWTEEPWIHALLMAVGKRTGLVTWWTWGTLGTLGMDLISSILKDDRERLGMGMGIQKFEREEISVVGSLSRKSDVLRGAELSQPIC